MLIIVLATMVDEIKVFFILLLVITGGFSCAFAVLLGGQMTEPWCAPVVIT